jgi:hypothetical protein
MTPYPDSQEAIEACCLGFDQAKVDLDGEQYITNCRCAFELNLTPQQELSGPVSCARQCTKTAGCKGLRSDMSEKCELPFNDLLAGSKPRDIATTVRSQETPGEKYEQEIEHLRSEKADLEGKLEEAELWLRLCQKLSTEIWEKRLSCEKLVAQAFDHRDKTLNALFQEATLDIWGTKFKMYFGKRYGVGTVAEGVGPLEHQHSISSCLNACSRDDGCKAVDYDPDTQVCRTVKEWNCIENTIPDIYDGRSISATRVGRKWDLIVANKARKVLEIICRAFSST